MTPPDPTLSERSLNVVHGLVLALGLSTAFTGWAAFGYGLSAASLPEALVEAPLEPGGGPEEVEPWGPVPSRLQAPPIATVRPLPRDQDLLARARKNAAGRYAVKVDGVEEALTLDAPLQDRLTQAMRDHQTPYAAVVAIEPSTGRILAMAEHSEDAPSMRGLPTRAVFPAASIFKVVTAAALLDAGVTADQTECFHGGKRRLSAKLLKDSARDSRCYSLAQAMGMSANVVFAKLTQKHLSAEALLRKSEAFRFNRPIRFAIPTDVSRAAIPEEPFALANTGSGFGDVYLSPLHGAMIASVAAMDGEWRNPVLLERDTESSAEAEQVIAPQHARALTQMMEETVTSGTARRVFRERGYRVKGAVGKTGSLADRKPFRDYSWFVGFAPKHAPRVAVAAVIVNGPRWRIRAPWLGREAMRLSLESYERSFTAQR